MSDLGGRPHFGVRLLLNATRKCDMVWTLKRPKQIPTLLPSGCKQFRQEYLFSRKLKHGATNESITDALKRWYTQAENEFTAMLGLTKEEAVAYTGRADGAKFVLKPVCGRSSSNHS